MKLRIASAFIACLLAVVGCQTKSQQNELSVYTSLEEPLANNLFNAFKNETGTTVKFVRLSTGEAAARLETEKNNPQAALWVGGVGLGHVQIKQKGLSEPYTPKGSESIAPQFVDPEHYWTGLYLGTLCFVGNQNRLTALNLKMPTSWQEALLPAYKGHIQMANPSTSGTAYNVITVLVKMMGEEKAMEYLQQLNANISQYTRSGAAPAKNAVLGETVLAIGYSHDAIRMIQESQAPLQISYPSEGTGYEIASISLIKGAKQTELAKTLYDWFYSKNASQIIADYYVVPLKSDGIKLKEASLPVDNLKLIHTDLEWDGKNKERLVGTWNDKINS